MPSARASRSQTPLQSASPAPVNETHRLRLRERALHARRDQLEQLIQHHNGLLRDLYHTLQTSATMTLESSTSIRAGEDSPELEAFLNEYSIEKPNAKSILSLDLDSILALDLKGPSPSEAGPGEFNTTMDLDEHANQLPSTINPSELPAHNLSAAQIHQHPVKEESPPPHLVTGIALSSLDIRPLSHLYTSQRPTPLLPLLSVPTDDLVSVPEPEPVNLAPDPLLPPLVSPYSASLYPLPPPAETHAGSSKRRKKEKDKAPEAGRESTRKTTNGNPVVDLTRWEATMLVNPTTRLAKKGGKVITTGEWQVMYNELRFLKAMQRINALKAQGLWSFRQPKKFKGPVLPKTHRDYMLEEMKWLQTDFREERRWKLATALSLANSAAEYIRSSPEQRKTMSVRWRRVSHAEDDGHDNMEDVEMMDVVPPMREQDGSDDEDDDEEDRTSPIPSRPSPSPMNVPRKRKAEALDEDPDTKLEEAMAHFDRETRLRDGADTANAVTEAFEDGQKIKEEAPDDDSSEPVVIMNRPEDANMADPSEQVAPSDDAKSEANDPVAEPSAFHSATATPSLEPKAETEPPPGLKTRDPPSLSSTATSIFDPKTLRGPILDLSVEDTVFNLSDMITSLNSSTSTPLSSLSLPSSDILLPALFPELGIYGFTDPPVQPSDALSDKEREKKEKEHRRIDESGMSSGRLTMMSRLMDAKNVLVSTLQPGRKHRDGQWDDLSDLPVVEEGRDYSEGRLDSIPPAAPMFCGVKARDHVHPAYFVPPQEPQEKESRLHHFSWTAEEDLMLKSLYNQFGLNWSLITDIFNSNRITIDTDRRTPWDCFQRWAMIRGDGAEDELMMGRMGTPASDFPSPLGASIPLGGTKRERPRDKRTSGQGMRASSSVGGMLAGFGSAAAAQAAAAANAAALSGGKRATRHALLHEAIKRSIKKKESKVPPKPRPIQTPHDTHHSLANQKIFTPAELSRLKQERDMQVHQHQIMMERRRQQELARQAATRAAGSQSMQVPNIAQQPRMGITPISAAQPVQRPPNVQGPPGGPPLSPAQQQLQRTANGQHAFLQQQQNAQMQAIAQQAAAQQAQVAASQNPPAPGGSPAQASQLPTPNSGHASPPHAVPPNASPNPNFRPPSAVSNHSPLLNGQIPAGVHAQAQAHATMLRNAGMQMPLTQMTSEQMRQFQQHMSPEAMASVPNLQQIIWSQQRANQQLQMQQQQQQQQATQVQQASPHPGPPPSPHLGTPRTPSAL